MAPPSVLLFRLQAGVLELAMSSRIGRIGRLSKGQRYTSKHRAGVGWCLSSTHQVLVSVLSITDREEQTLAFQQAILNLLPADESNTDPGESTAGLDTGRNQNNKRKRANRISYSFLGQS